MGSRTSSAPPGGLYKLDVVRKPGTGAKVEHTLLEEEEASSITGEVIKRTRFGQQEWVRCELIPGHRVVYGYGAQRASIADSYLSPPLYRIIPRTASQK